MRALAVTMALAGCGGTPPQPHDSMVPHEDPSATQRAGGPTVAWRDNAFVLAAVPAVARGGETVVVPKIDHDGGRGYPNLAIELRDRGDKIAQTIAVMTANEYETLAPGGAPTTTLTERISAANAELARQHGVHEFVAMHPLDLQPAPNGDEAHLAMGDSFDVDWNQDHLHVFHHNADHPLATIDGAAWLAKDTPLGGSGDVCHNPAFLKGVFHAAGINVLVVEIGYHGTDTCVEPPDQFHVIPLGM